MDEKVFRCTRAAGGGGRGFRKGRLFPKTKNAAQCVLPARGRTIDVFFFPPNSFVFKIISVCFDRSCEGCCIFYIHIVSK